MTIARAAFGFVLAACGLVAACTTTGATPGAPAGGGDGGSDGAVTTGGDDGGTVATFGPLDPGFTGTPAAVWSTSGGATIETWVPPGVDPGVARFDPSKLQGQAFVAQTFAMPAYAAATQYLLETTGVGNGVHARIDNMTLGDLVLGSTPSKSRICLGERAFGRRDCELVLALRRCRSERQGGAAALRHRDHG